MTERKFPIVLFSLIFAFIVWVSVNLGNQFKISIDVPVKVENLRQNQAIAIPLPTTVQISVQGTGWQLLNTLLTPNLYYTIDFKSLSRKSLLLTSRDLNERVNLSSDIRVMDSSPETLIVQLDEKVSKKVPVVPIVKAEFRDGFGIVGKVKSSPDSIVVTGARSLLENIHRWQTETIHLFDINSPVDVDIPLTDSLQFEIARPISNVHVFFDVQPIAEKTINDISVEILQAPESRKVVLIPPKVSIIVRSGVNNVANLSAKDFYAFIDYKSILLDTSGLMQANIVGPDNVQIVQIDPEKIQYVVRK
ncbi:MAG: CdaR family protein [Bacteroidota bacterium]